MNHIFLTDYGDPESDDDSVSLLQTNMTLLLLLDD